MAYCRPQQQEEHMKRLNIAKNNNNYHFIGIGGVNMSALAEILHNDGCNVTGSDKNDSKIILALRKKGIDIKIGHDAQNIGDKTQIVVYNAAVPKDNPEILAAKAGGLRLMDRAELLGRLMQNYETAICVAGTHGKTTTTSMLAEIFMAAGYDPTVMNGGILPSMGGALRIGARDFIIAEACEYNNSFLKFHPNIGIVLNIEMDHSDFFPDLDTLNESFASFAKKIHRDGLLVINNNVPGLDRLTHGLDCDVSAFGKDGSIRAENIRLGAAGHPIFDTVTDSGILGEVALKIPGRHNIQNALAAISASLRCGIAFDTIAAALSRFEGAVRRFQHIGRCNDAAIVDDYAHHPTEVAATIQAAKSLPHSRLWVVFQPHTRKRTAEFFDKFAQELARADELIILDIYNPAGREEEHCQVHAKDLAQRAAKHGPANCRYLPSFLACTSHLKQHIAPNDLVITMGAGDVHKIAEALVIMP
jgi:UDP-N-acetylmuramate--alanine ligase